MALLTAELPWLLRGASLGLGSPAGFRGQPGSCGDTGGLLWMGYTLLCFGTFYYRIKKSLRLEKISQIIESKLCPIPARA